MTKTNKKSKLLALFGLIVAGITALTCAILVTPRNTFASDSGISTLEFPDLSGYVEKDVNEGDTLAGKFFKVTRTDETITQATMNFTELEFRFVFGDSAYVYDFVSDTPLDLLPSDSDTQDNTNEFQIYIPIGKTYTTTVGDYLTDDLRFSTESLSGCAIKELVAPVAEDEPEELPDKSIVAGVDFALSVSAEDFNVKGLTPGRYVNYGGTPNKAFANLHEEQAVVIKFTNEIDVNEYNTLIVELGKNFDLDARYAFYKNDESATTAIKMVTCSTTTNPQSVYIDLTKCADENGKVSSIVLQLVSKENTYSDADSCNTFIYDSTLTNVAEEEDTRNKVEQWLDNAGDVISDWLGNNLGISIGGSVALVIVVAIIVAILKRKK